MNNAQWCDIVCRSHGAKPRLDDTLWTSETRTPPLYPDAVTLIRFPSVPDLLARVDASPGCSIKDSFASLDLHPFGFAVLFDAQWVVRTNPRSLPVHFAPTWDVVRDAASFAEWEQAWLQNGGVTDLLRPDLLAVDTVSVLAARMHDRVVAGGILTRAAGVVGISNMFWRSGTPSAAWSGLLGFADALLPGSTFVGYEKADGLSALEQYGFEPAGPLRVWITSSGPKHAADISIPVGLTVANRFQFGRASVERDAKPRGRPGRAAHRRAESRVTAVSAWQSG